VTWQYLAAQARLMNDGEVRFVGAVRSIQYGPELLLELEA